MKLHLTWHQCHLKKHKTTKENHDKDVKIFGIGITASLKTIDKKKGGHRFYIVSHNAEQTTLISNLQITCAQG